jgi:F-type H+-transporting ATPase subunit gamma
VSRAQELGTRINSLRELSGIIAAIRAMSAAQMEQGRRSLDAVRNYVEILRRALAEAAALAHTDEDEQLTQAVPRPGLVVFCSEHGFCGAFNEPLLRAAADALRTKPNLSMNFVGTRGAQRALERGLRPNLTIPMATHTDGVSATARRVAAELYRMFIAGTITGVEVFYVREGTHQEPTLQRLTLPPSDIPALAEREPERPPLVNMPPRDLRDELATEYMFAMLEAVAMESFTSENAARFRTMEAADENIERKTSELDRLARRIRQESVTAEILELMSGTEATTRR